MENEFRPKIFIQNTLILKEQSRDMNINWVKVIGLILTEIISKYRIDIELMLGTESGEVYIDFEEIKDEMEEQNSIPDHDVKTYFKLKKIIK